MLDIKFDSESTYLVPCDYTANTMALLDMLLKQNVKPIVLFINYSPTGQIMNDCEEKIKEYCANNGLILRIDNQVFPLGEWEEDDFSRWARKARYAFFERMYTEYEASALILSHTEQDLIETFVVQRKFGTKHEKYGFEEFSTYHNMLVIRPLLNYSNANIIKYCELNQVIYSEEMLQIQENYFHNSVRKEFVNNLNSIERENILTQMKIENDEQIHFMNNIRGKVKNKEPLEIRAIIALTSDEFTETIIKYVDNHFPNEKIHLKTKQINEIREVCLDPRPSLAYRIKDNCYLVKEYDLLLADNNIYTIPYTYIMQEPGQLDTPQLAIDFTMGAEDRGINADDYPITIRSALPQDHFNFKGYLVPVRKFMIDLGMPQDLLKIWPVVQDKNGKVIYVLGYGADASQSYNSIFVVKSLEKVQK